MKPRLRGMVAMGAISIAFLASAAPDSRADISLDPRDAATRHFAAEVDLGGVTFSLRLRWSAQR